jgi:hypothetical protein
MMASTLIEQLTKMVAIHGDIPVGYNDLEYEGFAHIAEMKVIEHDPNRHKGHWRIDDEDLAPRFIGLS